MSYVHVYINFLVCDSSEDMHDKLENVLNQ